MGYIGCAILVGHHFQVAMIGSNQYDIIGSKGSIHNLA